jgi:hypothetical protein
MHVVQHPIRRKTQKRMYLPYERGILTSEGLGELHGFNIGKMFKRMVTFKPSSFKFSNIMGALGSGVSNLATFGMGSAFAPKTFGAHSSVMKKVGMGVTAAAAAGMAVAAAPMISSALPSMTNLGIGLKSFGSGAMKFLGGASSLMKPFGGMFGGGGGGGVMVASGEPQIFGPSPVIQYPSQEMVVGQQASYVPQEWAQSSISQQLSPTAFPSMPSPGYGVDQSYDMQAVSPYSQLTDVEEKPIVPITGQISSARMLPQLSKETWLMIGGATVLGYVLYASIDNEKK